MREEKRITRQSVPGMGGPHRGGATQSGVKEGREGEGGEGKDTGVLHIRRCVTSNRTSNQIHNNMLL